MTPDLQHHPLRWWAPALAALVLALLAVVVPARSQAAVTKATSSYYQIDATSPVSGLKLTGYDGKNVYVAIQVSGAPVFVAVPTAAQTGLTLPFGYTSYTGPQIAFTGPVARANAALKALTIMSPRFPYVATGTANNVTLTVTAFEDSPALAFNPANQHFYRYVAIGPCAVNTDSGCTADEQTARNPETAKAAAEASTEKGLQGYLASITSADENSFVSSKIQGATSVIIGGRDSDAEGTWRWTGGPDNGVAFWQGCSASHASNPGTALGYASWSTGEPNNFIGNTDKCGAGTQTGTGEDCMVTNWTDNSAAEQAGYWNDVPCGNNAYTARRVRGYVVEYGNKPVGGDYAGVSVTSSTFKSRPYVPNVKPNFFSKVYSLLFMSKKRKTLPPKPQQPPTFTFQTKMQMVNPGTYVVSIKRKDGLGVPFLLLSGTKVQAAGAKAVTLGSSRWSIEVTTTRANQRVTLNPVLKTMDWVKPAGTKVQVELKTDSNMRCPLGWCQSTPIPNPRDQGRG